jgi:hypothetical protein
MKKKQAMPVLAGTAHFQFEQKLLLQQFGFKLCVCELAGLLFFSGSAGGGTQKCQ